MDISALIRPFVNRPELARVLDEVADDVRLKSLYELGPRDMAKLFDAAIDNEPLTLDHFVPADTPTGEEVVHDGKNSLAFFRRFQKRFYRPGGAPVLWGYNDQPLWQLTGPGYFVAYGQEPKEVVFDYGRVPEGPVPEDWPSLLPNKKGLAHFVYEDLKDVVRRVSNLVSVGRVYRRGRPRDLWFMLVRDTGRPTFTLPYPRP
ncbi:MAG TPA: hypothetical protein VK550_15500 [Polyangiaceae bacterium]|nr:hypothetical protein [Polyangiaceae bacterium]